MACINTCGSVGSYFKMAVENSDLTDPCPPATFDVNSERYEILNENVRFTDVVLGGNGLTGGLDPIAEHLRSGTRMVFGRILLEVGPYELSNWLPRILGNAPSGNTYTTTEVFDNRPFDILMSRDQGSVIYRRCSVNRAMLRARASIDGPEQILQLALDVIGYEEHGYTDPPTNSVAVEWPDPPPPLPSSDRLYWLLGDGKLELDTDNPNPKEEYYFDAFNLMFNNNLIPQTRNFLSITCLQSRGRTIQLQVTTPYTPDSHTKLYINRFDGEGIIQFLGTKNLDNTPESTYSTVITMPNLFQTRETPNTQGRGEIPLSLNMQAYRTGTSEPITITNNT